MTIKETQDFLEDFKVVQGDELRTELEARVFIGSKVIMRCKVKVKE